MKDVGLDQQALSAYNFTISTIEKGQKWTDTNFPIVREKTNLLLEKSKPYVNQASKYANNAVVWTRKQSIQLIDKLNEALPGTREKLVVAWEGFKDVMALILKNVMYYGSIALKFTIEWIKVAYAQAAKFL